MFFIFSTFSVSFDCKAVYTADGCPICITHYADRQCGWCNSTGTCMSIDDISQCASGKFLYGPEADCSQPAPPIPSPITPAPEPTQIPQDCSIYQNDGCEICTSHFADRNCGWNAVDNKCENNNTKTCDDQHFYYGGNAKCGGKIPTPTPTPWPVYTANTSFCRLLSDTWCTKCVSTQKNMSCVWCHDTNECAMGDKDGFFFGTCKSYSYENDHKCRGVASKGTIIGVRVGLAIFVTIMIVLGVFICYKQISVKPEINSYENVK